MVVNEVGTQRRSARQPRWLGGLSMRINLSKAPLVIVALAFTTLAPAAAAQHPKAGHPDAAPPSTHCGNATLADCTRRRVASLTSTFRELAAQPTEGHLTSDEAKHVKQYDRWLTATADKADALAQSGSNAITGSAGSSSSSQELMNATQQMQETQMSFNLQYLQLQDQMQQENRQYTAVSNIMKTKHDTAKNTIANIK